MSLLLGDVGGTNARLALARGGRIDPDTLTRYRGDDFDSFDRVVQQFLTEHGQPRISGVCVAVAGPVAGGRAELTNRDWSFTEDGLARLTDADHVRLINDLTALGYATPTLAAGEGLDLLRPAARDRARNGQSLVVGLGTGFNVCAVRVLGAGSITCMEAEEGHTRLPEHIMARLVDRIGPDARAAFGSTEETFAGRGLSRLHAALTGTDPVRAEAVAEAAAAGDSAAQATYALFAELFGLLLRELSLRFMPLDGIHLAGSVSRSMAHRIDLVEPAMLAEPYMRHIPEACPIYLIRDDMAALHGCLAALG